MLLHAVWVHLLVARRIGFCAKGRVEGGNDMVQILAGIRVVRASCPGDSTELLPSSSGCRGLVQSDVL